MRVLVAGGTGALGRPLVRALVDRGHDVVGLVRSPRRRRALEEMGATAVVADALDAGAVRSATTAAAPEAVVHALTALPPGGPRRAADMAATNVLRRDGTAHLLTAAVAVGARRIVVESMVAVYGDCGDEVVTEDRPVAVDVPVVLADAVGALRVMEDQVLDADRDGRIEGLVLRYGMFYGPEAGTGDLVDQLRRRRVPVLGGSRARWPWIRVEDAAAATVAAHEADRPARVLNVVDDDPASLRDFLVELARAHGAPQPWTLPGWAARRVVPHVAALASAGLRVSNARARRELSWEPHFPDYRAGIRDLAARTPTSGRPEAG